MKNLSPAGLNRLTLALELMNVGFSPSAAADKAIKATTKTTDKSIKQKKAA